MTGYRVKFAAVRETRAALPRRRLDGGRGNIHLSLAFVVRVCRGISHGLRRRGNEHENNMKTEMPMKYRSGNRPRKRVDHEAHTSIPRRSRNNSNTAEHVIIVECAQPTLTCDLIFIALVAPTCVVFVVIIIINVIYFFFVARKRLSVHARQRNGTRGSERR